METRIQKWGNSLAVRIPRSLAGEVGLRDKSPVDLQLRDGVLVITPTVERTMTLQDLLAQVTDENIHGEVPSGPAVGSEAW
jgi:antitoxin MazE